MNKQKILFFDDEALTSASLVKNLVYNYGHDITSVSSIPEFIEHLKNEKYSLLIIDVMAPIPADLEKLGFEKSEIEDMKSMEGMKTGIVLAKRVRREDGYNDIPMIFLTARAAFPLPWKDGCIIIRKPELAKNISKEIENLLRDKQ